MSQLHLPLLTPPSPQREQPEAADRRVFWRNFRLIAIGHVVILLALFLAGMLRPKQKTDQVLWLDGGSLGSGESAPSEPEMAQADPTPQEPEVAPEPEPEVPVPTPPPEQKIAPSEIVEPKPTPVPATPKPALSRPTWKRPRKSRGNCVCAIWAGSSSATSSICATSATAATWRSGCTRISTATGPRPRCCA